MFSQKKNKESIELPPHFFCLFLYFPPPSSPTIPTWHNPKPNTEVAHEYIFMNTEARNDQGALRKLRLLAKRRLQLSDASTLSLHPTPLLLPDSLSRNVSHRNFVLSRRFTLLIDVLLFLFLAYCIVFDATLCIYEVANTFFKCDVIYSP